MYNVHCILYCKAGWWHCQSIFPASSFPVQSAVKKCIPLNSNQELPVEDIGNSSYCYKWFIRNSSKSVWLSTKITSCKNKLKIPKNKENVYKTQKNCWNVKNLKMSRGMPMLAKYSLTRSLQSTGKRVFRDGTHTHTDNSHILQLRDCPVGKFCWIVFCC